MKLFIFVSIILITCNIYSHTSMIMDYICPIDSTTFSYEVDCSGTSFYRRLDLKKIGPIAQPWRLPQCPKCKFVLYNNNSETYDIVKLKPFILSDEFQNISELNSSHYFLAKIYEYLKYSNFEIAWTYLQASWQVEGEDSLYFQYLKSSLINFKIAANELLNNKEKYSDYLITLYLQIEINRKLGDFDEAQMIINDFPELINCSIEWLPDILDFQEKLIKLKDSSNHDFNEVFEYNKNPRISHKVDSKAVIWGIVFGAILIVLSNM